MTNRRGETLIDIVMGTVLPIVGGIAGTLFFRQVTSLPTWGCFLLGLPLGTVVAWAAFVALAYVVVVPAEKWSEWRRRKRRQKTNRS